MKFNLIVFHRTSLKNSGIARFPVMMLWRLYPCGNVPVIQCWLTQTDLFSSLSYFPVYISVGAVGTGKCALIISECGKSEKDPLKCWAPLLYQRLRTNQFVVELICSCLLSSRPNYAYEVTESDPFYKKTSIEHRRHTDTSHTKTGHALQHRREKL